MYFNWSIFHPDSHYLDEFTDFSSCKAVERYEYSNNKPKYDNYFNDNSNNDKYKPLLDTSSFLCKNLKRYEERDDDDDEDEDNTSENNIDLSHLQISTEMNFIPINSKKLQNLYPKDRLIKELIAFMTLNTFHLIDGVINTIDIDNNYNNNKINMSLSSSSSTSSKINNGKVTNGSNGKSSIFQEKEVITITESIDNKNNLQILYFILCKCYKCNCNYYAPSLQYLFRHLERKHPIPTEEVAIVQRYNCPIEKCSYTIDNRIKFLNHILQHNFYSHFENLKYLDNSSLIYECVYPECSYNTKNEMSYTAHILNHTNQVRRRNS